MGGCRDRDGTLSRELGCRSALQEDDPGFWRDRDIFATSPPFDSLRSCPAPHRQDLAHPHASHQNVARPDLGFFHVNCHAAGVAHTPSDEIDLLPLRFVGADAKARLAFVRRSRYFTLIDLLRRERGKRRYSDLVTLACSTSSG